MRTRRTLLLLVFSLFAFRRLIASPTVNIRHTYSEGLEKCSPPSHPLLPLPTLPVLLASLLRSLGLSPGFKRMSEEPSPLALGLCDPPPSLCHRPLKDCLRAHPLHHTSHLTLMPTQVNLSDLLAPLHNRFLLYRMPTVSHAC